MRVVVDARLCKGYANCIVEAPDVFSFDDNTGKSVVIDAQPDPDMQAELDQAIHMCPVHAISLQD